MNSWLSRAVNYQINLRAFAAREPRNPVEAADERPDARSPLAYLTANLAVIKRLGVTVLHLMPPFPIGMAGRKGIGSPYAVRDYRAINPEFGTLEEFGDFVRAAHGHGFKVIIGIVPNHTSRDNVWVGSNPEFYVRDAANRIAYDLDWSDTAKLDYRVPGLRRAMFDVIEYWLTFLGGTEGGVDGFRFDMAHFINHLPFWDETLPVLQRRYPDRPFLFLAECYGMQNNLDLFRRGMTAAYDDDFYKICEQFYGVDGQGESLILPSPEVTGNPDLKSRYELFQGEGIAGVAAGVIDGYEKTFSRDPAAPRLARYTDNHDEGRGLYRFGAGAIRAVNQLIFFSPHTIPFLLTGEEFGALNRPSIHDRIRPCDKGRRIVAGGGVTRQDGVEFEGSLFARGVEERARWYSFFRELIRFRLSTPELMDGAFRLLDVGEGGSAAGRSVMAFERTLNGSCVRCAVNLGPEAHPLRNAHILSGRVLYGGIEGDRLAPFSGLVVGSGA